MKKITFILLLSLLWLNSSKAEEKKVEATIKQVTVFLNRAQIHCEVQASILPGITDLVIEQLPTGIDKQSIQVNGKGEFIILGVKHNHNFLKPQEKSKGIIKIETSIDSLQFQIETVKSLKDVFLKEEQMILSNQTLSGKDKGISSIDLKNMADFFRVRLKEIKNEIIKSDITIKKLNELLYQNQNQLQQQKSASQKPSSQIVVSVKAKDKIAAVLEIDYITTNAGWYPVYDIRSKGTKSGVQFNYKAEVFQNTGVNWNSVKLTLSTSNPSLGGTKPILNSWFLDLNIPNNYKRIMRSEAPSAYDNGTSKEEVLEEAVATGYGTKTKASIPAQKISDYVVQTENTLAAEFEISLPYSIPSTGKTQLVDVKSFDLPATYKHFAVPKLDKDVFLLAQVTGWEALNLLEGKANIYFEGSYVGESNIDPSNMTDTLDISLGRDKKVIIERKAIKDITSKSFIGLNIKQDYGYEISIRNNKKEPISLIVEDQFPISKNKEIEVELNNNGGAAILNDQGKLIWNLTINATEAKKVNFQYSVKYPKNKNINGL